MKREQDNTFEDKHHTTIKVTKTKNLKIDKGDYVVTMKCEPDNMVEHKHHTTIKVWDSFGKNTVCIAAKNLKIASSDDESCWEHVQILKDDETWLNYKNGMKLREVCLLEVKGSLDLAKTQDLLSPNKTYELFYIIKFKCDAFGLKDWPVSFKIAIPGGQKIKRCDDFKVYRKNKWHKVYGGEFSVGSTMNGKIRFGMYGIESGELKGGIILHGVLIQPKQCQ